MEIVSKLVLLCTVMGLTTAQLNFNNPDYIPEYIQTQSSYVEALQEPPSDYQLNAENVNTQQLPREDAPRPFFSEPSTVLRAPTENAGIGNFNYPPIPAQELQLPSLIQWNPENDPNLYYPVVIQKLVPTNLYPKKYDKSSEKVKPFALKIKQQNELINESKQKNIEKVLHNYAKQENRKQLNAVPPSAFDEKVKDPQTAASGYGAFSSSDLSSGGNSFGGLSHGIHGGFGGGSHHGGDRMEFHMQGHDGPKSYKWGYDTGKGPNRHFRFEERDKHGYVKGHYGYYDKHGKLRMIHYDSDPYEGFHANGDIGPN